MKYNTTNISTSGSMLSRLLSALAAGAAWAKAGEMNTIGFPRALKDAARGDGGRNRRF